MTNFHLNTTVVAIFPNVCLWRRSLCSDLTLKNSLDPEKLYRATFICQDGLCCCNVALISFRLFRKHLGNLRDVFEQMVYRPPWQKISRTPMDKAMNQRFYLACDEELSRPQAETSSVFGRRH